MLSRSLIISLNMCNCGRQLPSLCAGGRPCCFDWVRNRRSRTLLRELLKLRWEIIIWRWSCVGLYLKTWGHVWRDESLHAGRLSERQLEPPQYFKPGLMGHVWMQQQGTASSSCPHICWINEEICPKKHGVHWQMITAAGKDVCICTRVIAHHRESVHTLCPARGWILCLFPVPLSRIVHLLLQHLYRWCVHGFL